MAYDYDFREKATAQDALHKTQLILASTPPIFREIRQWAGPDLKQAIQRATRESLGVLPSGEVFYEQIVEWFGQGNALLNALTDKSDELKDLTLPVQPSLKGMTPDRYREEAADLLDMRRNGPNRAPNTTFHTIEGAYRIAYKLTDIERIGAELQDLIAREKKLVSIGKTLDTAGKHPNFKMSR